MSLRKRLARTLLRSAAMRSAPTLCLCLALVSCVGPSAPADDDRFAGPPVLEDDSADGAGAVDVVSFLRPDAPVSGTFASHTARTRFGYVLWASAGTDFTVEVTQSGSSRELDTALEVYGPRDASGRYVAGVARDDDAGWGALSKAVGRASEDGFYLAIVSVDPESLGSGDYPTRSYRMALSCSGTCATEETVAPAGLDIRWVVSAAEFGAASVQSYALATARLEALAASGALTGDWGVSLDVDETVLSNAAYQRERAELGVGYTSASWTRWVAERAAPALPGAKAFVERVRELGGRVALVTNRKAHECEDTEANLHDEAVPYDVILCRTDTSDKNPRFESLEDGTAAAGLPPLSMLLFVGDNIQDFPGLSQDVRFMGEPGLADFGDRFVVIPNPMYGSWERNAL